MLFQLADLVPILVKALLPVDVLRGPTDQFPLLEGITALAVDMLAKAAYLHALLFVAVLGVGMEGFRWLRLPGFQAADIFFRIACLAVAVLFLAAEVVRSGGDTGLPEAVAHSGGNHQGCGQEKCSVSAAPAMVFPEFIEFFSGNITHGFHPICDNNFASLRGQIFRITLPMIWLLSTQPITLLRLSMEVERWSPRTK